MEQAAPSDLIYTVDPPSIYPPISTHTPPTVPAFRQPTTTVRPTPVQSSSSSSSTTKERKSKLEQQVAELTKNQSDLTKTLNLMVAQLTHLNESVQNVSKKGKGKASGSDDDDDDKPTPRRRRNPSSPPSPPHGGPGGYPGGYPHYPQPPQYPQNLPLASPPIIKLAAPDMFSGDQDKLKDWFRQVENHFYTNPSKFPTEDLKILFAFSYIRGGKAGEWARHMNENFLNSRANRPVFLQDLVTSWEDMRSKMEERFRDRFEKETARSKLRSLRQAG